MASETRQRLDAVSEVWEELSRLARISRAHTGPLARALDLEIEAGAVAVLAVLAKDGAMRLGALAVQLGLSHSVASRHVASLEALGYVERTPDRGDRRAQLVSLTSAGRAHLEEIRERHRRFLADALATWDPSDIDRLGALLRAFADDLIRVLTLHSAGDDLTTRRTP